MLARYDGKSIHRWHNLRVDRCLSGSRLVSKMNSGNRLRNGVVAGFAGFVVAIALLLGPLLGIATPSVSSASASATGASLQLERSDSTPAGLGAETVAQEVPNLASSTPETVEDTDELEWPSLTEGVERTVLENGLVVLTKEVHTAPVVAVQVWYRVGSADETIGNNGISHQLEHLLFKGTRDRPIQFGRLFDAVGSSFNAFTTYDATGYFHTVSRDRLDTILELEADRMVNTLIAPEAVDSEKRVVISELQGYENSPSYRLNRAVRRTLYASPKDTSTAAYSLPVGGTRADVEQFQPEQIQAYYRQYYAPDNAVLAIVGDFERHTTLASVRKTFGNIRPSERGVGGYPALPVAPGRLEEEAER